MKGCNLSPTLPLKRHLPSQGFKVSVKRTIIPHPSPQTFSLESDFQGISVKWALYKALLHLLLLYHLLHQSHASVQRSGVPEVFMHPQRLSCTLPFRVWIWPLVEGSGWATAPRPHLPTTNALRLPGHILTWLSHPHQVKAISATRPCPIQQVLWRLWPP